jgi:LacI family transcriptional regulator
MKRITQNDIAKKVGISRSTVQRALNNSGPVEEEVYKNILEAAKELGYKVNLAAKQLAQKKPLNLHAFLVKPQNYHIHELFRAGFKKAISEKDYNVSLNITETPSDNEIDQKNSIKNILFKYPDLDGIILHPIHHHILKDELKSIRELDIPIISLDSDVGRNNRLAFIGQNYYKGGRILGDLLTKILQAGANIITISPDNDFEVFQNRLKGFSDIINKNEGFYITHPVKVNSISNAYHNTANILKKHRNIRAIFTTINIEAVAQALIHSGRTDIFLCGFDLNDQISELIKKDIINIALFQRPKLQGYIAAKTLLNYLVSNEIKRKEIFAGYDIVTKENLDIKTEIM